MLQKYTVVYFVRNVTLKSIFKALVCLYGNYRNKFNLAKLRYLILGTLGIYSMQRAEAILVVPNWLTFPWY